MRPSFRLPCTRPYVWSNSTITLFPLVLSCAVRPCDFLSHAERDGLGFGTPRAPLSSLRSSARHSPQSSLRLMRHMRPSHALTSMSASTSCGACLRLFCCAAQGGRTRRRRGPPSECRTPRTLIRSLPHPAGTREHHHLHTHRSRRAVAVVVRLWLRVLRRSPQAWPSTRGPPWGGSGSIRRRSRACCCRTWRMRSRRRRAAPAGRGRPSRRKSCRGGCTRGR